MTAQYPRVLASALSVYPADRYRGLLYRVGGTESSPTYVELARCEHLHRNRRKALECAEELARLDGAPQDIEP